MGIVIVGATFVDIKGYPFSTYIPAGRNAGYIEQVHGGVCRNVAEDIANLELKPTFVSILDDTGIGMDVMAKLKRHKVNTDYILTTRDGMGTWLAIFDQTGDVVGSISKRPDLTPLIDLLDQKGDEIFHDADSVVIEIDIDPEIVKRVFCLAEKYHKQVFAIVSNISLASERRDFIKKTACFICNQAEAGALFLEDYENYTSEQILEELPDKIRRAGFSRMVVTLGANGAVYADQNGESGYIPAMKVSVVDTTGAGDSFFAGVATGLTYQKSLRESCIIGTRLAASVISTSENVCPRFLPEEFGL